jgi:hypothetical protein
MKMKLFAVYLGGRAAKCQTELHDVVFAVGETIEQAYPQLINQWFGTPKGLHLDSWVELDVIDGHKVELVDQKPTNGAKLFFMNLGAYQDGAFTEIHANKFIVAATAPEAKGRAKRELLKAWPLPVHTDDLHDVDDCLQIADVGDWFVTLTKTDEKEVFKPANGYHLIPKNIVQDYIDRHPARGDLSESRAFGEN